MQDLLKSSSLNKPCKVWNGVVTRRGRGQMTLNGKITQPSRATFLNNGGVLTSERPWVLHKCNNPLCYEFEHLYAGNNSQNQKDSVIAGTHANAKKTHCPHGHKYDTLNTCIKYDGSRRCRTCHRIREAKRRA